MLQNKTLKVSRIFFVLQFPGLNEVKHSEVQHRTREVFIFVYVYVILLKPPVPGSNPGTGFPEM
jgi:hypothetical protein